MNTILRAAVTGYLHTILNAAGGLILFLVVVSYLKYRKG